MKQTILAKRYAKALFAVGKEEGNNDEYSQFLSEFAALIDARPEVIDALTNPLYPQELRGKVMAAIVKSIGCDQIMGNFLNLLVQKKRAEILADIADVFQQMVDADRNISRGTITTAVALEDELKNKVRTALEKITGKQVLLETRVDPSIIGGMIAKVGDLVMDGSIKRQLTGLNESIKGSE
ncbi:MAG: F0F1 ATP synthase subunit delta [Desulfobacterales bacterium]|nr:F0F1 ATP synthase subunit delta [Desulfobacterales bacterium]